ncbi:MAG: Ig-like domain-containing protein [Cyanobacteria bacterium J06581_3]
MNTPLKIATIGDSITQADNGRNSYRRDLWNLLTQAGYNVDFVGSENKNKNNKDFPDSTFDPDHEGHWGWRTDEIINGKVNKANEGKLADWLLGYTPDIALIHLGSNDAFQNDTPESTADELKQVIDILRQDNPNVVVFLAQVISSASASRDEKVDDLNALIPAVVTEKTQPGSPVILVNQNTGFNAAVDTYDGVHPNVNGEAKMALKWFDAIDTHLGGGTPPVTPLPFEAEDDSAIAKAGIAVTIDVFGNDTISEPFTLSALGTPANGTVEVNENGTPRDVTDDLLTYTANSNFTGVDSFTYTIENGSGKLKTAEVQVSVSGPDPEPEPEPEPEPGNRVEDGLLSLYTFSEGTGNTVFDVSGVGTALNLKIDDVTGVQWGDGTLTLNDPSLIASQVAATKLTDGIQATQEITIEAWIASANTSQSGPARIATLSSNSSNRNFTLGQQGDDYNVRFRTTSTGKNGAGKSVSSPGSMVTTALTHVVYTREADGDTFLYLNNELAKSETIEGDLSNWNDSYQFALGNELAGSRDWLGTLDLVAVYNQAFDAAEVLQNFRAGADGASGSQPPVVEPPVVEENTAPVANADTATLTENTQKTIDVLANDTDADGDSLSLTAVSSAQNGTAAIVNNQVVYTPAIDFVGNAQFTYSVSDGNGGTDSATVSVSVTAAANIAPVANADTATLTENTQKTIDVLANDTDADGDPLSLTAVSSAQNGTAAIVNNQVVYTPAADFVGTDQFTYSVTDGEDTVTGSVNVTVNAAGENTGENTRVEDGLLSLYTFDEGSGNTVFDVSGVGTALDLTIDDLTGVSWGAGVLNIDAPSLIVSQQAATKLTNGITGTGEITIEAWVAPENSTQSGPARIATLSASTSRRNFTLGQQGNEYNGRLRTTVTGRNGSRPSLTSVGGQATTEMTHVVYTREADGDARMYVDNQLVGSDTIAGDLSNWDSNYKFALGAELNGQRAWLGSLDLVAVYNQAFDAGEVEQNFLAGASLF